MAGVLEPLGERDHLGDVLGRPREDVRRQDVDERLVGVEGGLVRGRDLGGRLVLEPGLDQHPVLAAVEPLVAQVADVGDVLDVEDLEPVVEQGPPDQVGQEVAAQVADVGVAVDRRAAGVHPDAAGLERLDRADRAGEGVAQAEGHGAGLAWGAAAILPRGAAVARKGLRRPARILPPMRRRSRPTSLLAALVVTAGGPRRVLGRRPSAPTVRRASSSASPTTLDPAAQGDADSSAVTAQLFETLTTFDGNLQLQPALAESWRIEDGGTPGRLPPPPGPVVLRRHAAAGQRRRPELAPPDRPGAPVAARLARARHRRRAGLHDPGVGGSGVGRRCTRTMRPAT